MRAVLICLLSMSALAQNRPPPTTQFIGSGSFADGPHSGGFSLLSVSLNNSAAQVQYSVLMTITGYVMFLGDATAFDPATNTYFVTLSDVTSPNFQAQSLFALNVTSRSVLWKVAFVPPAFPSPNFTMGMLAWDAGLGRVLGMCGTLMWDLRVSSFCSLDPETRTLAHLNDFSSIGNVSYDPDTRALDPNKHLYYARLYTVHGVWMPDNLVTLSAVNGSILNAVYGGGPEYAGAAFDRHSGQLWCGSNAPGGIDLCLVDMQTGSTMPTGAWVADEGHGTTEIFAASVGLDGEQGWHFVSGYFSTAPGLRLMAVDISNANISLDRIIYNYTFPPGFPDQILAGLHTWAGED
jgi:hypothetical protein